MGSDKVSSKLGELGAIQDILSLIRSHNKGEYKKHTPLCLFVHVRFQKLCKKGQKCIFNFEIQYKKGKN